MIGNVVVDGGRVSNVSYIPSSQHPMHSAYVHEEKRLAEFHAAVATAAKFGVFRIEGPKQERQRAASRLADQIRMLKGIDPTLGLYAAYAYSEAGLKDNVASVRNFMRGDLQADLFDVALLAGALSRGRREAAARVFPFCPMLSQGWGLLRVQEAELAESIGAMRDHLRVSLWLTLEKDGMDIAEAALREKRVG